MARLFFMNDYNCGCAPEILARLTKENLTPHVGYGSDEITKEAAQKILDAAGVPEGGVYFAAGGTQANSIVISHFLKTYQGVICAQTGTTAFITRLPRLQTKTLTVQFRFEHS